MADPARRSQQRPTFVGLSPAGGQPTAGNQSRHLVAQLTGVPGQPQCLSGGRPRRLPLAQPQVELGPGREQAGQLRGHPLQAALVQRRIQHPPGLVELSEPEQDPRVHQLRDPPVLQRDAVIASGVVQRPGPLVHQFAGGHQIAAQAEHGGQLGGNDGGEQAGCLPDEQPGVPGHHEAGLNWPARQHACAASASIVAARPGSAARTRAASCTSSRCAGSGLPSSSSWRPRTA